MEKKLLPDVTQSPDDLLGLPVAELLFKLYQRAWRASKWPELISQAETPFLRQLASEAYAREKIMLRIAAAALRIRALAVAEFAQTLGLACTQEEIKRDPQAAARHIVSWIWRGGDRPSAALQEQRS